MNALNQSTRRRLQHLRQAPSVWEGDRRRLTSGPDADWLDPSSSSPEGDCILWVDGSQGMVRGMDVVAPETGPEAVVRTLIRAMEHPHSPGMPMRPKKIVVRDRELQFFLRGVLQDLDITLDYAPELPLIDEIFRGLQDAMSTRPPQLPPGYAEPLMNKADDLWKVAPWELLADHQIIAIEINHWDIGTLYASVMGMLGMEYGVLFYRSLESLKQFRQRAMQQSSLEEMQEAFLGQDCLFLTYESEEDEEEMGQGRGFGAMAPPLEEEVYEREAVFGNLHPLEGLRSFLYDDEAGTMLVALEGLHRFIRQHRSKFQDDAFPSVSSRYKIPLMETEDEPTNGNSSQHLSVKVSSLPELAAELLAMEDELDEEGDLPFGMHLPMIRDDLIPENSFLSLGMIPWSMLEVLRISAEHYQPHDPIDDAGEGLPVIMVQTSRPKAKALVEQLQAAGGLQGVCFNPGEDPIMGDRFDVGLLQSGNGELHLFGEFGETDPNHKAAKKKWDQRCKKTKGVCGLVIAKGLTGAARGNPQLRDMVALFETQALTARELGLGTLQLSVL
jgi:hypothetical protein